MANVFFHSTGTANQRVLAYADDDLSPLPDAAALPGGAIVGSVRCIAESPDGTKIAMATDNAAGYLLVYDAVTFEKITIPSGNLPSSNAQWCAWSPDGTKLAVAHSGTGYIFVYNVSDWSKITITGGVVPSVASGCAWSPDGTKLAVAHFNSPYLTVYNVSDWSKITLTGGNPTANCRKCEFSPDGTILAAITDSNAAALFIYNVADWSQITPAGGIPGIAQNAIRFSKSGAYMAIAATVAGVYLYTVSDWTRTTLSIGSSGTVNSIDFNDDDSRVAFGISSSPYIKVYEFPSMVAAAITYTLATGVTAVRFSSLPVRALTTGVNVVMDIAGSPAAGRTVRAYARFSGALLKDATTDASGKFLMRFLSGQQMQLVILDDDANDVLNDLVLGRVVPVVEP